MCVYQRAFLAVCGIARENYSLVWYLRGSIDMLDAFSPVGMVVPGVQCTCRSVLKEQ